MGRESLEIEDEDSYQPKRPPDATLGPRHIAPIIFYIITLVFMTVTYLVLKPFDQRRVEFPTLVTLGPQGDVVWLVIAVSELIYVMGQATIYISDDTARQVAPWFIFTCIFQMLWLMCIIFDFHVGSLGFMTGLVVLQVFLCLNVDNGPLFSGLDCFKYWFFRVPFSFHGGWVLVLWVEEANIWSENSTMFENSERMSIAVTSLGTAFAIMTGFAIGVRRPDPLFCAVFGWGMWWMASFDRMTVDVNDPKVPYNDTIKDGFNAIFYGLTFIAICYTFLAFCLRIFQRICMKEQGSEITVMQMYSS